MELKTEKGHDWLNRTRKRIGMVVYFEKYLLIKTIPPQIVIM